MRLCVNLVVILLTFDFLACAIDRSSLDILEENEKNSSIASTTNMGDDYSRKLKRPVTSLLKIYRSPAINAGAKLNKVSLKKGETKGSAKLVKNASNVSKKSNKLAVEHDLSTKTKTDLELRDTRRRHVKKMNRAMMALLMAYKLKFAALIPTIIGGLALLVSTTALAGFFFALFAAVLGLKAH